MRITDEFRLAFTDPADSICDRERVDRSARPVDWRAPAAVAIGSVIGALGRWGVGGAIDVEAARTGAFPWQTLLVNVVGCALIGLAAPHLLGLARTFVVTGVLGGFTTMSALAVEVNDLSDAGRADLAAIYVAISVVAGVGAAVIASIGSATDPGGALEADA